VLGDVFTALAYFVIPFLLYRFVKARSDVKYPGIFWAFSLFILCCGITHLLAMVSVWHPIYRAEAVAKVTTALVSMGTVGLLFKLYNPILAIPSPAQLEQVNAELRREIEHRKKTEEQLRLREQEILKLNTSLEEKVRERTSQLEELNDELETFSYSVSHDLRAPLKNMEGMASMLKELYAPQLDDNGKTLIRHLYDNAQRMDRLITDFLNFSQVGQQIIQKEHFDIGAQVREVYAVLSSQYPGKNIQFTVEELPQAYGDANLIRQVVQNLISNALKYASGKEEIIIRVNGTPEEGKNIYAVSDNGVGFDPKSQKKLFMMFQRLHTSKQFSGHGIGLAFSYRIIKKHGGHMWADARPGEGAQFFFSLPNS
jgi:light-regulated signal transduction histidine kinase (bacteriophytochrome)